LQHHSSTEFKKHTFQFQNIEMNSISKSIGSTASLFDDTQSFGSFDPVEFGTALLFDTQSSNQEKFSIEDEPPLEEEWEAVQSMAKRRIVVPPIGRCGCKKSQCIMLYCNCFHNGLKCNDDCMCKQCANTKSGNSPDGAATKAKAMICQKNPDAFKGKEKKEGTGCGCKNNRCLKKYCACLKQGISCDNDSCGCIDCKNPNSSNTVTSSFGQSRTAPLTHRLGSL